MRLRSLGILSLFFAVSSVFAVKIDGDLWGGYTFGIPSDAVTQACDKYPSTGDDCRNGGFSFGASGSAALGKWFAAGVGINYLSLYTGTLRYSTTQSLSMKTAYLPILAQLRFQARWFYTQVGLGYAAALDTPKLTPYGNLNFNSSSPWAVMAELGVSLNIAETVSFIIAGKGFVFYNAETATVSYAVTPILGFRALLP